MATSSAHRTCVAFLFFALLSLPARAWAQLGDPPFWVSSVNLANLADGELSGEIERCIAPGDFLGCLITVGAAIRTGDAEIPGVSPNGATRKPLVDADVTVRLRLHEYSFRGVALGLTAGLVSVVGVDVGAGLGLVMSYSWRLKDRLFISPGLGLKTVLGMTDRTALDRMPIARLNVGLAF